jgi:hypothetical protein
MNVSGSGQESRNPRGKDRQVSMAMTQHPADPEEVRRIIRLMDRDPEIREEVRRAILTQEVLELPQRLAAFIEATNRQLAEVDRHLSGLDQRFLDLDQRFSELDQRLAAFVEAADRRFAALEADGTILKIDVGDLKGGDYERRVRERAPAILSQVAGGMRRIRVLPVGDLADQLDEAVESALITVEERQDALQADAVARAISRDSAQAAHLVVEASVTLGRGDVDRAIRRAHIIARGLETKGVPVVVTSRVPDTLPTTGAEVVLFGYRHEQGAA